MNEWKEVGNNNMSKRNTSTILIHDFTRQEVIHGGLKVGRGSTLVHSLSSGAFALKLVLMWTQYIVFEGHTSIFCPPLNHANFETLSLSVGHAQGNR